MAVGVGSRVSRVSQLKAGLDDAGVLENQIRAGLTIDSDVVLSPTIANAIQVITSPVVADADTVPAPALGLQLDTPLVQDADTVNGPTLDLNILLNLVLDQDTVPSPTLKLVQAI